jgi:hypothetical protein
VVQSTKLAWRRRAILERLATDRCRPESVAGLPLAMLSRLGRRLLGNPSAWGKPLRGESAVGGPISTLASSRLVRASPPLGDQVIFPFPDPLVALALALAFTVSATWRYNLRGRWRLPVAD